MFDFFVRSVAIDFHAIPTVRRNCMHINHTCLSVTIIDLNRLFAKAVSGAYRQLLNFWKRSPEALKNNSTVPSIKKKIEDNEKINILTHKHKQMYQKCITYFNSICWVIGLYWLFSFSLNWDRVEKKERFFLNPELLF